MTAPPQPPPPESRRTQVTYSHDAVLLPEATSRDANNVQRFWRRSKGYWLITHGHEKLERLLGRRVK